MGKTLMLFPAFLFAVVLWASSPDAPGAQAVFRATDWQWRQVNGTAVEAGGATVDVFDSRQTITMVRFPMRRHTVSVVESDGKDAGVTSWFGTSGKAIAAINGSYFDMETLLPVTYVKDEGKVLCTRNADWPGRSNGMFRIRGRKGRRVDVLSVDSLTTPKAAKWWREAIVSGPVLLEEGRRVEYDESVTDAYHYRKFFLKRHPRTLIGYTSDGWIYFIVVDGRVPDVADGMSISELQVLCEALGLREAINLDGGGSSTLWTCDRGVISHPCDNARFDHAGERAVPNAVICY